MFIEYSSNYIFCDGTGYGGNKLRSSRVRPETSETKSTPLLSYESAASKLMNLSK